MGSDYAVGVGGGVQAYDELLEDLADIAGTATAADQFIVSTAVGAFALEDAAAARNSIGAQAADGDLTDIAAASHPGGEVIYSDGGRWDAAVPGSVSGVQPHSTDLDTYDSNPLTAAELGQLQNIGAATISPAQWGYLGAMDQSVATGYSPTFHGMSASTGNITASTAHVVAYGYVVGRAGGSSGEAFRVGNDISIHDIGVGHAMGLQGITGSGGTHAAQRYGSAGAYVTGTAGRIAVSTNAAFPPSTLFDVDGTLTADNIYCDEFIVHTGDGNTYFRFLNDQIDFYAGGVILFRLDEGTQDLVHVNPGLADVDTIISSDTETYAFFMRASDGKLGLGTSSPSYNLDLEEAGTSSYICEMYNSNASTSADVLKVRIATTAPSGAYYVEFRDGNSNVGEIRSSGGGNVYYATASDRRLKEDIRNVPVDELLDVALRIPVRRYRWRSTGNEQVGCIADEVAEAGWTLGVEPEEDLAARNARPRARFEWVKHKPERVSWTRESPRILRDPADHERLAEDLASEDYRLVAGPTPYEYSLPEIVVDEDGTPHPCREPISQAVTLERRSVIPASTRYVPDSRVCGEQEEMEALVELEAEGRICKLRTEPIVEGDEDYAHRTMDYGMLSPLVLGALQAEVAERRAENAELRSQLDALAARVATLEAQ
ncbi:MAG: tail fiber domain-containing protein [Deltaproteobacteria bacterium]|nr:tail fiber domain-containing protein [Deltaproteobacteria bacterium]